MSEEEREFISGPAAKLLREMAEVSGCTQRQYLEALLHYAASCQKRPGSWEANKPFDLAMYLDPECHADKWFQELP